MITLNIESMLLKEALEPVMIYLSLVNHMSNLLYSLQDSKRIDPFHKVKCWSLVIFAGKMDQLEGFWNLENEQRRNKEKQWSKNGSRCIFPDIGLQRNRAIQRAKNILIQQHSLPSQLTQYTYTFHHAANSGTFPSHHWTRHEQ
ncbi:hypothetical protein SLEP1_g28034 [Rubroshorea leprosula]|uniref:Uncharacterized protein n=1 Tax=Rubroshorea leprosula TaxID=152421 RepID=A0AAV5K1P3_9ROSI|nr:hypothetical protein SLEP1_g28034 [Rubroshorea leprosula]